ncbi:MAG: 6-phosphogluconolactonase [Gemmatimonadota bacterium]
MTNDVRVFPDMDTLSDAAAAAIRQCIRGAVADRGEAVLALSGGHTPEGLFRRLALRPQALPWKELQVFWVDERWVSSDDPHSNFGTAQRGWFAPADAPPDHLHPIPTDRRSPGAAAEEYERLLRGYAQRRAPCPLFDLVILGLGTDGHTASLFPDQPAPIDAWVAPVDAPAQYTIRSRVTLTPLALNQSRNVMFLVSGAEKAPAVRAALAREGDVGATPSRSIRPRGRRLWFVDEAAYSQVSTSATAPEASPRTSS